MAAELLTSQMHLKLEQLMHNETCKLPVLKLPQKFDDSLKQLDESWRQQGNINALKIPCKIFRKS